ncbi:hypothetical protein N665_1205s0003 [Sinapis alba]|nr:hypothetical protein N665_1205s0003 [Sinapis alba]
MLCPDHGIELFEDEVADVSVTHMVSLIEDDFPFEINTWRGGVKATNVRNLKSPVEDGLEGQDLQCRNTNTHPPRPNTVPPPLFGGCFIELKVRRIIRHATDDVEERLEAMLVGYFASLQGYMADEFWKINEADIYHGPFEPCQPTTWVNREGAPRTGLSIPPWTYGDRAGDQEGGERVGEKQLPRSNDGPCCTTPREDVCVPGGYALHVGDAPISH